MSVLVLDFGSQVTQLIARRVREAGVYCEIVPFNKADEALDKKPGAIILLHDGNVPPERLVTTVKLLLESLHRRGYEAVRLDKILSSQDSAASAHSVSGSAAAPQA